MIAAKAVDSLVESKLKIMAGKDELLREVEASYTTASKTGDTDTSYVLKKLEELRAFETESREKVINDTTAELMLAVDAFAQGSDSASGSNAADASARFVRMHAAAIAVSNAAAAAAYRGAGVTSTELRVAVELLVEEAGKPLGDEHEDDVLSPATASVTAEQRQLRRWIAKERSTRPGLNKTSKPAELTPGQVLARVTALQEEVEGLQRRCDYCIVRQREAQEALDTLSRPQESEGASLLDAFSAAARSSLPGSSAGDGFTWVPTQFREFTRCCSLLPRAPSGPKEHAPALRGEATAALKE